MKNKTMKRALSLFLATVMIALALPLSMIAVFAAEAEATPATIKTAKMYARYGDDFNVHALYGSVAGMIDGDPFDSNTYTDDNPKVWSTYPYFWSDELSSPNTTLYIDSVGEERTYYGYAVFELNALSTLDDVTIWLAADGKTTDSSAAPWSNPKINWNMINAYDILVSTDGETWTLVNSYDDMCGTGSAVGAGWSAAESAGNIASGVTKDGYQRLGHRVPLDKAQANYVAVAVKEGTNETNSKGKIVIGEVTVNGVAGAKEVVKTPAEIYADATDGDLLYSVNFNNFEWNDDYYNSNNWNTYAIVSEDGLSVGHLLNGSTTFNMNTMRAMWGGIASDKSFSLDGDEEYTLYFDMKFLENSTNYGCGIQVDGVNTLLIDGAGNTYWYRWHDEMVGKSGSAEENWVNKTDKDVAAKQSFAIEITPDTNVMTLYVADSNGLYTKVRTLTFDGAYISGLLSSRIYIRNLNGATPSGDVPHAEVSNIKIYKGHVAEAGVTSIKYAKMFTKYGDDYAMHPLYGSVNGMIDGDKYDESRSSADYSRFPYYYSDKEVPKNTSLYIDSINETRTYYGYAMFELNAESVLDDVTIWLAADGHTEDAAVAWSNPKAAWNMNNAYDILVSEDGETWTLVGSYDDMCGTGSAKGAGWSAAESAGNIASVTKDGYQRLGHRVPLDKVQAKYVAVAVTEYTNDKDDYGISYEQIVIGEVSVNGKTTSAVTASKSPAAVYDAAKDGALLDSVNFNEMSWNDDYKDMSHWNSYYIVTDGGSSVEHLLHDEWLFHANKKRAMWGGISESESFPLRSGYEYTLVFDMTFGESSDNFGCGIQVDGTNTLLIDGAGNSYWYKDNSQKVGKSDSSNENWVSKTDKSASATQTFAVEINPETGEMTLSVAKADGTFARVRTLTFDGAAISGLLNCRIYIRNLNDKTPNDSSYAKVSNLQIYKGFIAGSSAASIERVKMIATYSDGWALHPLYGSVAGMIDGDRYDESRKNPNYSVYPYYWSTANACKNTSLYVNSIDETRTYYGYALFELNAPSALDDVTIWLAADGNKDGAGPWGDPNINWNMNNAYDILVSVDGETWTLMGEYDDMCGTGSAAGTGWTAEDSLGNIVSVEKDGFTRLGHRVNLNGAVAKYVAVAVKECTNETSEGNYLNQIVIGEVSVNGVTTEPVVGEKTPTEIYEETEDGDLLYSVNFKDTDWSDDYYNQKYHFSYYILSEDGTSVKHGLTKDEFGKENGNTKRVRWGGIASDKRFTLTDEERYTIYFDAKFAGVTESFGIGIQVDPDDTLMLDGAGNSYWYCWNTQKTGKSDNADENWLSVAGGDITKVHSFAIELNPHTDEMTLYVADASGVLVKVRTLTWYEGEGNSAYLNGLLECSIFALSIDDTEAGPLTNCEISDIRIYKGLTAGETRTVYGASVRLDNPTGIRFRSQFSKSLIDSLMDTYGAENVKIGMLITPTDYITRNGVDFTMAALDACTAISGTKYVKIDASAIHENDSYYVINCALVNLQAGNYYRQFSARAYIEVNGEVYKYSEFNLKNNSRSVAEVAEKAYNDVKAAQDSVYSNAIKLDVGTTAYSPYTTEGRNTLKGFFNENTSATLTVMTYNIRAYGDADSFWESITGNYEGWAGRDPKLALETITELMPDVVGLQEDDKNLYNEYSKVAGLSNYARITDSGNGNEGNEILYKKNAGISLVKSGVVYYKELAKSYSDNENVAAADFSLDTKGNNNIGRFFRWAIFEKDGVKFLVINTHLHYKASSTESSSDAVNKDLRKAQATLIRLWLAGMASECANQIVMGDMNAQEDSKEMKGGFLEGTGALSLAENNAVRLGDTDGTLVNEGFVERQPWAYDHIFFSANTLKTLEFSVVDNIDVGANTNYPSDHVPVVAKFIAK